METVLSYIQSHWVDWFFALCIAGLGLVWRTTVNKLKLEHEKNEAIAEGVQSLLRESIVTNYNRYSDKGFCPIYAKENVEAIYKAYAKLGGNHTAKSLYEKLMQFPEIPKTGGEKPNAEIQGLEGATVS